MNDQKHKRITWGKCASELGLQIRFIAILALACLSGIATAEEVLYFEPHTGYKLLFDSNFIPKELQKIPGPPHSISASTAKAGNATFALTFGDVTNTTGVGFDDPTLGATRRATAQAVADYLNSVLNTSPASPPTIEIDFADSETDGTGFLASAGTLWFTLPNRYDGGFAKQHLTTGVDPSGVAADINVTVDFGHNWNNDFGPPAFNESDLPSVLLHEFTHGLGFAGLIKDEMGLSSISDSSPGVYTDLTNGFTLIAGSIDLFDSSFAFVGLSGVDLVSDDVAFSGANATAANAAVMPKMYFPGPNWVSGSSGSHMDTVTFPNSVMKHAITDGTTAREFTAVEIGVLQDIGYTNAVDLSGSIFMDGFEDP